MAAQCLPHHLSPSWMKRWTLGSHAHLRAPPRFSVREAELPRAQSLRQGQPLPAVLPPGRPQLTLLPHSRPPRESSPLWTHSQHLIPLPPFLCPFPWELFLGRALSSGFPRTSFLESSHFSWGRSRNGPMPDFDFLRFLKIFLFIFREKGKEGESEREKP